MKMFGPTGLNVSFAIIASAGLALLPISEGWAQQKCKRSGAYLAQDSKYTEQHVIDVGDVPGHQVRILELHRTPSNAKPNCEGLKVVETWSRGYSDYTNLNGRAWGYDVTVLENGDKIFGQYAGTAQTTFSADVGSGVVVVREVEAMICSQCGEEWIDDSIARQLERIVNDARARGSQVEVAAMK